MKTFTIGYYEEATGSVAFEAESLEEAEALIEKVRNGELFIEELEGYGKKERTYEEEFLGKVEEC